MSSEPYAVISVSYNSAREMTPFLRSFQDSTQPPAAIIVVDNASGDAELTREIVESHGGRFLALAENRGYGGGANAALPLIPAGITRIVVANPDVIVSPTAAAELGAVLDAQPSAGAVGPCIFGDDGERYPSARALPTLGMGIGHALFANIWPNNPWSRRYREPGSLAVPHLVGWLSGAFLFLRKDAFTAIRGFDEEYFMYFEDVDLGLRLERAGWGSWFAPDASVVHHGARSTSRDPQRMRAAHHRSAYRYLSRIYDRPFHAPLRLLLRLGLAIRGRMSASPAPAATGE